MGSMSRLTQNQKLELEKIKQKIWVYQGTKQEIRDRNQLYSSNCQTTKKAYCKN